MNTISGKLILILIINDYSLSETVDIEFIHIICKDG
jgi:hypothetical protein